MASHAGDEGARLVIELGRCDADRAPADFSEKLAALDVSLDGASIGEVVETLVLERQFALRVGEVGVQDEPSRHRDGVGDGGFGEA